MKRKDLISKAISINVSFLLLFQQIGIAGEVIADTSAAKSNQATIEKAQNGVPVVNIVAPNSNGLSHNKYTDYNVNKEGLILNNSNQRDVNTQLSGYIYGNQNLAGKQTATTILNEVTSRNKSELKGYTEIAGNKASVVVANPNGIYINGAGFINTTKATITTGIPNVTSGNIDSYRISQGAISIDGDGLNTTNVDKAELYSKVVSLNAKIQAKNLDVVTGKNEISKDGIIQKIEESDSEKPSVSLDSSALGGIYANKISLIGTQSGVGVNLPIEIMSQDDFKLNADGKIVLDKVISKKNIDIKSNSSDINSNVIFANSVNLDAKNELNNKDTIASKTDININATKVTNENLIASGVDESLNDLSTGNINITAQQIENKKALYAKSDINLDTKTLKNSQLATNKASNINIKSDDIVNEDRVSIVANNNINIQNSNNIVSNKSKISAINGNLQLNSKNIELKNSQILAKNDLNIINTTNANLEDSTIQGNKVDISSNELILSTEKNSTNTNKDSNLISNSTLNINVNSLKNVNGYIGANGNLIINSKDMNNSYGTIVSNSNLYLNESMPTSGIFVNEYGLLQAGSSLLLNANSIVSRYSSLVAKDSLGLISSGNSDLEDSNLQANKISISVNDLILSNQKDSTSTNKDSNIVSNTTIDIKANNLKNVNGYLASVGDLTINSKDMNNTDGVLITNGNLSLSVNDFSGINSKLQGKNIDFLANSIFAQNSNVLATNGYLKVNSNSSIDFSNSNQIAGLNDVTISGYDVYLDKTNSFSQTGNLIINSNTLRSKYSNLTAGLNLSINNTTNANLEDSTIQGNKVDISSNELILSESDDLNKSSDSVLKSATTLNINSNSLKNINGYIGALDDIKINSKNLDNSYGTIVSKKNLTLNDTTPSLGDLDNTNGLLQALNGNILLKFSNMKGNNSTLSANDINLVLNTLNSTNLTAIATNGNLSINSNLDTNLNSSYLEAKNGSLNLSSNEGNLNLLNSTSIGNNINFNANSIVLKGDVQDANSMLYSTNDININSNDFNSTNFITQASNNVNITSSNISLDNSKIQSVVEFASKYINGYKQGDINLIGSNLNITNASKLSSNNLVVKNKNNTPLSKMIIGGLSTLQTNSSMTIVSNMLSAINSKFDSSNKIDIKTSSVKDGFDNNNFSAKNLDLTVYDDLELKNTNSFKTTDTLNISAKSLLNNTSLVSDGDIVLKSLNGDIVNNSLISSNGLLNLDSGTSNISNNLSGIIKGRKTLINTNILINKEFISALETLDVNGNDIINYAGMAAVNLDDESKSFIMTFNANNFTNYNTLYSNGNINLNIKNNLLNITDNNVVNLGNDSATIFATNNINIGNANLRTDSVKNLSANMETNSGNINIVANDVLNGRSQVFDSLYQSIIKQEDYRAYTGNPRQSYYGRNNRDDFYWLDFSEYNLKVDMPMVNTNTGEGTHVTISEISKRDDITSKAGTIYSGKNINIDSNSLTNEISLISSKENINFTNSNMNLKNKELQFKASIFFNNFTGAGPFSYYTINPYTLIHTTERSDYSNYVYSYNGETINSTIEAGSKITGVAGNLQNGMLENQIINYTVYDPSASKQKSQVEKTNLQTDIKSSKTDATSKSIDSSKVDNVNGDSIKKDESLINAKNDKSSHIDPNPIDDNFKLPTNKYGLFTAVDPNKNLNYLIETNPLYTNLSNYTGSQYFLDKLNYKADKTVKRLGDAAYETKLVRDSIVKQTGGRFLADYASENAQFVALMDSAVNVSGILGLKFGKAPTQEQLSNLKENIVWMEEKIVENQLVLVPVVYLANNYDSLKGATITAQKGIDLKVKDAINNIGTIKSNDYITLTGKSITNNQGVILADGKTSLISTNDFINKNGGLIKGGDVQIASINGNVINQTFAATSKVQNGANDFTYTLLGKQSSIQSTNGNLVLQAKNNIENIGADLSAFQTLSLNAQTGDVNFKTLSLENGHNVYSKGGFDKALDVEHVSSSASGENVVIKSGNDINLEAAKLNATNQINLNAKNDVNVTAVNDVHYTDVQTSSKGTFSKKSQRDMSYKEEVNSAELNAKDIVINGNNNVNLEASKLNAKDNLIVNAQNGDLNITAKEYKESELHMTSKSSFGGLSKSMDLSSSDAVKLKSANIQTTGSNIVLTSGKDINVVASNINSGKDILVNATNNLNVVSQAELSNKNEIHEKSSFNLAGLTALVGGNQSIYKQEVHDKDNTVKTNVSSNLNAGGNIVVNSGTTNIIGSNLEANNIAIKADTGSINVLSAQDMGNSSSLDKKIDVKLNNVVKGSLSSVGGLNADNTKLKVEVASASYDEEKVKTNNVNNLASNLKARDGNVVLDALTDINVKGSNLNAKDTIALNSTVGDINISNSIDTKNQTKDETHAKASLNLTVQNEYVETVQAVRAVEQSAQQLKQTKDDYSKYKSEVKNLEVKLSSLQTSYKNKEVGVDSSDIEDLKEIISNLKSQDKYYVAAISAATVDLASKSAAAISQAEAAAKSYGTAGFSAGVSLDVNGNKTNTNSNSITSNASNLNANNILLQTNNKLNTNVNITGSNVIANENLNVNTHNLNVIASQDSSNQTQNSKSVNGSVAYTMYGGGGGTANLGYGTNNSNSNSVVNHNSNLQANNMNVNVSNDANFVGATVRANDTLNLKVGNNLNVESVRDEYSSSNKGFNVNAGVGFGSAGAQQNRTPSLDVGKQSSTNAGFSINNGISLDKQTVLSSITGNKVNVDVKGNTDIKGSLIASGNFDENNKFIDNKNLNFNTNTLSFENMSNTNYSSNQSIGLSANYNLDSTKVVDNKTVPQQGGVSSASYNASNSLNVNATKTLATLGTGNINIKDTANSDDLSRLNTDTTKINKDLYSSSTGTKVDATLDTRLLSVDGINQIKDEAKTASTILTSINQIASTNRAGILDFFKETEKNVKVLDGIKSTIASNPELAKQLSDPNITPEQKQSMISDIATSVAISLGYLAPNTKLVYTNETGANNEQIKGHYSSQTDTSYVNDKNNDSIVELVNTTAHETQHYMDAKSNVIVTDKVDNEKYVNNFANTVTDYTDYALSYTGNQSMATTNNHNNQIYSSSVLIANNKEFSSVNKSLGEDRTVVYIWKGVGYGSSAFGHVSTSVNDTSYSFGKEGMDIRPLNQYMEKQSFRSGIAVEIPLSATEEKNFESFLKSYDGKYWINYCPSPVNQGLQNLGYKFDSQIIPMSFYMEIMKNNIGTNPTIIEKKK